MILRDFQEAARQGAHEQWQTHRSTLIVLPTGSGKTSTFSVIINDFQPKRAVVLAHRRELIEQAVSEIHKSVGLESAVEMGDRYSDEGLLEPKPVIVGTVQTVSRRLEKFFPGDFGLLVIDEMHHGTAPTYRKVLDHFSQNPDLKILGVTATPERADQEALSQVCESVAFNYGIAEAVRDGWLVDVTAQFCQVNRLDLSEVHTTAGDLNQGELSKIMEQDEVIMGCAQPIIEVTFGLAPKTLDAVALKDWKDHLAALPQQPRRGIVFTVSVAQAEGLCGILNLARKGLAEWVCGKTEQETRAAILRRFQIGETAIVVNCAVLTEGYNNPAVETIFMARPTKSHSLFQQMIGRSTRPLPGLVDGLATPEERRKAIAGSPKPFCRIVDFCGNSGRHKLVTPFDVLGGNISDDVIDRAKKDALENGKPVRVVANLNNTDQKLKKEAKQREEDRKRALVKADHSMQSVNLFGRNGIGAAWQKGGKNSAPATENQRRCLGRAGVHPDWWTKKNAGWIIGKLVENHWRLPADMDFVKHPKRKVAA